jgi:hypothetical protein
MKQKQKQPHVSKYWNVLLQHDEKKTLFAF